MNHLFDTFSGKKEYPSQPPRSQVVIFSTLTSLFFFFFLNPNNNPEPKVIQLLSHNIRQIKPAIWEAETGLSFSFSLELNN